MERDLILNGINIGETGFDKERVLVEIKERCIDAGYNFVSIRPRGEYIPQESFIEWAKYLAENKIYFIFLYATQQCPDGQESWLTDDTIEKMKEIAGEYYLGELFGETGSQYACKLPGYYVEREGVGKQNTCIGGDPYDGTIYISRHRNFRLKRYNDMKEAYEGYIETLRAPVEIAKRLGTPNFYCVEANAFAKHNAAAGIEMPVLEICPGNSDILVPIFRGTAKAFDAKHWGTYVAHAWYGGLRHEDPLKMKRLELTYKYAYLAGSSMFVLENGDKKVRSYGMELDADSEVCANYRRVLTLMQDVIKGDARPAGGPKAKVGFVSGLYDGWAGKWGRSCLYNQFHSEEWGYSDPEYSWKLLFELNEKRSWSEPENYGEYDTSSTPAYGQFDIVPIEADVDHLSEYDYLIFLGWNTMTEENMKKLTEYVRRGGHLVMSAAHLNTQTKRNGEYIPIDDDLIEELFGCRHFGEIRRTINGVKFRFDSLDARVKYPRYLSGGCDAMFTAGYADYLRFATCSGKTIAYLSDGFTEKMYDMPAVIENKVGRGVATLFTSINYPGNQSIYFTYRAIVREIISASSRECDIKVVGSDRVRWAVYEGNKMYLLNTDYDVPVIVKVMNGDKEQTVTLEPLELRSIQL